MAHIGNDSFNNTVAALQAQGFQHSFSFVDNQLVCVQSQLSFNRYEFSTIEMHFYPGEDHAATERMLYAIEVPEYAMKGLLVVNGVNNNIQFLEIMNRKYRPPTTETEMSVQWKYMTIQDFFY